MNRRWLPQSILAVVASIVGLSVLHYGVCQFWANPVQWRMYERTAGKLPDTEHMSCKDVGPKTLAILTSVLATLLALHSEPPGRGE